MLATVLRDECGLIVEVLPIVCRAVGGTTLILPTGHFWHIIGLHAVCTDALHQRHLQSCNLKYVCVQGISMVRLRCNLDIEKAYFLHFLYFH